MKTCSKCEVEKPETEFFYQSRQKNQLHTECKMCYKEYRKTYHREHYLKFGDAYRDRAKIRNARLRIEFRTNMLQYMHGKSCLDCGESDLRVLELDHINPAEKLFNVSQAVKFGFTWKEVLDEIKKCRILCANCHKKRTAQQFNWYKAI